MELLAVFLFSSVTTERRVKVRKTPVNAVFFDFIQKNCYNICKVKRETNGGEKLKNSYVANVCTSFRRNGLAPKYEYPGIYCIKLDERVVYIGKS